MVVGPPPVSPYTYTARDYQGLAITITFNYDNTTRVLQNSSIHCDSGCVYSTIYIGVGTDGSVQDSTHKIPVPQGQGSRTFSAGQLAAIGLNTIDDILTSQITAA